MDNNNISEFPEGINLLIYNLFQSIGCVQLISLKHLYLRQNKMSNISENISQLQSLLTLSLSSNLIEEVPDSISELSKYFYSIVLFILLLLYSLQNLYLNGNKITHITQLLSNMTHLEVFNYSNL